MELTIRVNEALSSLRNNVVSIPVVVRKLQEFESPYISLKAAQEAGTHRIVLRRRYVNRSPHCGTTLMAYVP